MAQHTATVRPHPWRISWVTHFSSWHGTKYAGASIPLWQHKSRISTLTRTYTRPNSVLMSSTAFHTRTTELCRTVKTTHSTSNARKIYGFGSCESVWIKVFATTNDAATSSYHVPTSLTRICEILHETNRVSEKSLRTCKKGSHGDNQCWQWTSRPCKQVPNRRLTRGFFTGIKRSGRASIHPQPPPPPPTLAELRNDHSDIPLLHPYVFTWHVTSRSLPYQTLNQDNLWWEGEGGTSQQSARRGRPSNNNTNST
jgi:hypothetical protein